MVLFLHRKWHWRCLLPFCILERCYFCDCSFFFLKKPIKFLLRLNVLIFFNNFQPQKCFLIFALNYYIFFLMAEKSAKNTFRCYCFALFFSCDFEAGQYLQYFCFVKKIMQVRADTTSIFTRMGGKYYGTKVTKHTLLFSNTKFTV